MAVTGWTGIEVRAIRSAALRMTQTELAEQLGFTESVVRKWEKRGATITLTNQYAEAMDTLLARLDPDQRRRFEDARSTVSPVPQLGCEPFDRSDAIVGRLQHLAELSGDGDIVDGLNLALGEIINRYEAAGPRRLAGEVQELRQRVNLILQQRRHPAHVEQLHRIAARLSGVLAYMAVNCGRFGTARMYCREAQALASLIEDREMLAWVKSTESFCVYYAGDAEQAVNLAAEGIALAESGTHAIRLYSNGLARAWGKLGDPVEVERAIDQAMSLADHQNAVAGLTPALTFEKYGKARLMANAATAFLSAGRYDKALEFGGLVEDHVAQSDSAWSRSLVRLDVATALVLQRSPEVEHAVQLGVEALDASADRPIRSVWQRASELGALMQERYRVPSREYTDQLTQWRRSAQPLIAPEGTV